MIKRCLVALVFLGACCFSCNQVDHSIHDSEGSNHEVEISYAEGFQIIEHGDFYTITLNGAWRGEESKFEYLLYRNEKPSGFENAVAVKIPIQSITCMSLTHLAFLNELGLIDKVNGVSGGKYSSNQQLKVGLESGKVVEVGSGQTINYEAIVEQNPDVVMAYGIDETSSKYISKLKDLGLTVVLNAEYMETHPLGKAEWIKFMALFFDELASAEELFESIEHSYTALLEISDTIQKKPTVFVGMPWQGNWYVAGGKSFQAQLFTDAGADYIWKNNQEKSSIVKSLEVVVDQAMNCDYWLNVNSYQSISEIEAHDNMLSKFSATKEKRVYNNNKRLNSALGNDYWETGVIEPQIVLKDLIEIFHPGLLDHELKYYQRLE